MINVKPDNWEKIKSKEQLIQAIVKNKNCWGLHCSFCTIADNESECVEMYNIDAIIRQCKRYLHLTEIQTEFERKP